MALKKKPIMGDKAIREKLAEYLPVSETVKVNIPYEPRPVQMEIEKHLKENKFNVLVTHRQMGKTICVINHIIKEALKTDYRNARYFYVAPSLKQAKRIAWDNFKKYLEDIPYIKINETELTILLPNGSKIFLLGVENADAMRGSYANGVVLDEYAMCKDIFEDIVRPMFTNTDGWCIFTSTPKGQNHFYNLWLKSQSGLKGWWGGMYTAETSGVIDKEELKDMKEQYSSENMFRQEMMCDFTASSDDILIKLDDVFIAQNRQYRIEEIDFMPTIIGVDCARFGEDKTVISVRKGYQLFPQRYYQGLNQMEIADKVVECIKDYGYDGICIDQAFGVGVIDRLRQLGYDNVFEVNFNMASGDEHYYNKRAEMWGKMADWIRKVGALPKDNELLQDLTCVHYSFCGQDKVRLEAKELVKKRLGKSPDQGDSLAISFAFDIQKRNFNNTTQNEYAEDKFNYIEV